LSATFSPDGKRVVIASSDNTARIWDVSRTETMVGGRAIVFTAALARGVGWQTQSEHTDPLMRDAPKDLFQRLPPWTAQGIFLVVHRLYPTLHE
jgi:hypothetical protein